MNACGTSSIVVSTETEQFEAELKKTIYAAFQVMENLEPGNLHQDQGNGPNHAQKITEEIAHALFQTIEGQNALALAVYFRDKKASAKLILETVVYDVISKNDLGNNCDERMRDVPVARILENIYEGLHEKHIAPLAKKYAVLLETRRH